MSRMPPPPPPPVLRSDSSSSRNAPTQGDSPKDFQDKYYKLKHLYWDLQDKFKDVQAELQKSGDRNHKLVEERSHLLNRIIELEGPASPAAHAPGSLGQPPTSALPRSLLAERSRDAFTSSIRDALEDVLAAPSAAPPASTSTSAAADDSRPLPPSLSNAPPPPRKRDREDAATDVPQSLPPQQQRREEEHSTPSKRRRVKGGAKGKDSPAPPQPPPPQPTTTVAVSSVSGKRIRIKPPVDASAHAHVPPSPSVQQLPPPSQQQQQQPQGQQGQIQMQQPQAHLPDPHAIRDQQQQQPPHAHSVSPLSSLASPNPNGEYPPSSSSGPPPHPPPPPPVSLGTPAARLYDPPDVLPPPHAQPPLSSHPHPSHPHPHLHAPPHPHAYPHPHPHPHQHVADAPHAPAPPPQTRLAKPKRLKAHTVTSKSHSIPTVPRDAHGRPVLPLNVGIMTVLSLGHVCLREHFHTERYIFPVGYEVTRRYLSAKDPHQEVTYHCTILDGGDAPKFQIVAADQPDKPIVAGTATGAWSVVVRAANHLRNRQHSNSVSGPDFFGLGQNTIKHLIQQLPDAERLRDYVWQTFVEGGEHGRPLGGRHAAVVPAAAVPDAAVPVAGGEPMDEDLVEGYASAPLPPQGYQPAHYHNHSYSPERDARIPPEHYHPHPHPHHHNHNTRSHTHRGASPPPPPAPPPAAAGSYHGSPPASASYHDGVSPSSYGSSSRRRRSLSRGGSASPVQGQYRPVSPAQAGQYRSPPPLAQAGQYRAPSPAQAPYRAPLPAQAPYHSPPLAQAQYRSPPPGLAALVHAYDAPPVRGREWSSRGRSASGSASVGGSSGGER